MKLLKSAIDILIGSDGTTINVYDQTSSTQIMEIKLTPEQLSKALSRLSMTPCEVKVGALDRINKKHENVGMEFEIPEYLYNKGNNPELHELAVKAADNIGGGWVPDKYYGSQNSFFKRDGKSYARVTVRRWIDIS